MEADRRFEMADNLKGYLKPLFGFALRRVGTRQDAEDLVQEILLRLVKSVSSNADIQNMDAYVWSIARYTWTHWLKRKSRTPVSVDWNGMSDRLGDGAGEPLNLLLEQDTYQALRREIAHLSDIQRRIVIMYYYNRMPQNEIATALRIPVGTVKWHLHDAKKEMKKGMEQTRSKGELGFNPVELVNFGHAGSPGQLGETGYFLKRALPQNISYALYHNPMTIADLARELGVPPMFIKDEVEELTDYGFLAKVSPNKYRANFIIYDFTKDQSEAFHRLYEECAEQIAKPHFDALMDCRKAIEETDIYFPDRDYNFLLWTLLPKTVDEQGYRSSLFASGDNRDSLYPPRKDGGRYIAYAQLKKENIALSFDPKYYWYCGSMIRKQENSDLTLWQFNTYWSDRGSWQEVNFRDVELCHRYLNGALPEEEAYYEDYAFLLSKGYLLKDGDRYKLNVVWMDCPETAERIRENTPDLSKEYEPAVIDLYEKMLQLEMKHQPKHLEPQIAFRLKLNTTGGFLNTYILKYLVDKGLLSEPLPHQRKTITTMMGFF